MNDQKDLTDTEAETEQALDLEEDDRLPWLESAEDYDESDSSAGRILGLVVLGLIALALVVGAIYWLQNREEAVPEGDGSLIAAPQGDYKTAPDDVQATQVEGTGDASFAASQGKKAEGQLAGSGAGEASGGVLVQLGAFSTEALAQNGWNSMARRYDYVASMSKRISEAKVDGGTVYRLSAVASDASAANSICDRLKKAGENCLVIR
jgi:cell division septation protein DedD